MAKEKNWQGAKDEYITSPEKPAIAVLARRWNLSGDSLQKRCSRGAWKGEREAFWAKAEFSEDSETRQQQYLETGLLNLALQRKIVGIILATLEKLGGAKWFEKHAKEHPGTFFQTLVKLLQNDRLKTVLEIESLTQGDGDLTVIIGGEIGDDYAKNTSEQKEKDNDK